MQTYLRLLNARNKIKDILVELFIVVLIDKQVDRQLEQVVPQLPRQVHHVRLHGNAPHLGGQVHWGLHHPCLFGGSITHTAAQSTG